MERLLEYSDFPGGVVAQDVAALLDAVTLPAISQFGRSVPGFLELPDYIPFPGPIPEPLSKVGVSRAVVDSALEALAALKRLEDRTAACKARLVAKVVAPSQVEASALGLDSYQRGQAGIAKTAQIATTLCIPARTASMIEQTSTELVTHQKNTLSALDAGALSWRHAQTVVDELSTLAQTPGTTQEDLYAFESALLRHAPGSTAQGFVAKARKLREGHHPETLATRTRQAIAKREMILEPSKDGMSWLTLHLPAVAAQGIWVQCTRMARAQQHHPDEHRTLTQLRVDTATAILLGQQQRKRPLQASTSPEQTPQGSAAGSTVPSRDSESCDAEKSPDTEAGSPSRPKSELPMDEDLAPWDVGYIQPDVMVNGLADGIDEDPVGEYLAMMQAARDGNSITEPPLPSAQVIVTVPVMGLLGLTDDLAELTGHGPIPASIVRKLLGESNSFLRVLTDPITGVPLDLQPENYRMGAKQRTLLAAMEQNCSFPNCNVHALLADMDHLEAFQNGGKTTSRNLQPLCKRHHQLKHFIDDKDRSGQPRSLHEPDRNGIKLRGWKPRRAPEGGIIWISPSGKEHQPPPRVSREPSYPKRLAKNLRETNGECRQQDYMSAFEQLLLTFTPSRPGAN